MATSTRWAWAGSVVYLRSPEARRASQGQGAPVNALLLTGMLALVAAIPLTALFGPRGALGAAGAAIAAAVFLLAVWRTGVACVILALAVPLTAGLGRGTVIPLLRPGEVLILLTLAALLLKRGLVKEAPPGARLTWLDGLVVAFVGFVVLVPALALIVTQADADLPTWMSVLAPAQFLIIYWIYSRSQLDGRDLRLVLNAMLLASVIVGFLGLAQAADLPGVRSFSDAYFPAPPSVGIEEAVYRANSTLEHFSALGAFGVFNFALAFALHTNRVRGFPSPWLGVVMLVNGGAIVASQTWASAIALPFVCLVVCLHARRLPPHLGPMLAAGVLAGVLLWPMISSRFAQQQLFVYGRPVFELPHTMEFRMQYWKQFFLPSLMTDHRYWFGTGTVIPSDIPRTLVNFVDNEFIRMAFRAGVGGVAMLLVVQFGLLASAWRAHGAHSWAGVLGGLVAGSVVGLLLMELTAEYMGFAGVSQLFWMMVGLFSLAWSQSLAVTAPEEVAVQPARRAVAVG